MLKFCIELVDKEPVLFQIIHQFDCPRFPNADVLALPRFKEFGAFASHTEALQKARESNPDSYACQFCCGQAPLSRESEGDASEAGS